MIQSRLTFWGICTRFVFFLINFGALVFLITQAKNKASVLEWCEIILFLILIIIISLILLMKTRNISVDSDKISYTNWVTGKVIIYYFKNLDGYITIIKPIGYAYQEKESVILAKGNKRIGEISHLYYSNYDELKGGLKNLKDLGRVDNNEFQSIKYDLNELFK